MFFKILQYLRKLVGKFGYSVMPKVELAKICGLAVKQCCPTRWWTDWLMCERFMEIHGKDKEAINKVITLCGWKKDFGKMKEADLELISYFVDFFKVLKVKSDILGGEESATLHMVHSSVREIQKNIRKWKEHPVIGSFTVDFDKEFSHYFDFIVNPSHVNYDKIFAVAAYLSPFHHGTLSNDEKRIVKDYLHLEVSLMDGGVSSSVVSEGSTESGPVEPASDNMIPGILK